MDQGNYSGYYQSSYQSTPTYGSASNSARASSQTSPPRSYTQYSPASPDYAPQPTYSNQPYDPLWQEGNYPAEECSPREATRHGRSVSHSPGPSNMTSSRRREQNRLAQRALRQRRENHIKELEDRVLHTSLETRHLAVENRNLNQQLHSVALENDVLRHEQMASSSSAAAWAQHHAAGAGTSAYSSYANVPAGANAHAQFYHTGQYSLAPASRSISEPTPSSVDWPWDDAMDPRNLDPSFAWTGEEDDQSYSSNGRGRTSGGAVEQWLDERPPESWRRGM
jgi:hypothetical protein